MSTLCSGFYCCSLSIVFAWPQLTPEKEHGSQMACAGLPAWLVCQPACLAIVPCGPLTYFQLLRFLSCSTFVLSFKIPSHQPTLPVALQPWHSCPCSVPLPAPGVPGHGISSVPEAEKPPFPAESVQCGTRLTDLSVLKRRFVAHQESRSFSNSCSEL